MLDITAGTVLADRYVIGEQLGLGGTGVVWQAHDNVLRRDVALKVVRNGEHERLAREARAAAGVNDRRVVAVYDAGQHGGTVFLVMELVHGVDLAQVVRVCGALSSDVTAMIGHDLASGLGAVHEAHIIHRDIKPSNVMLTREGDVKLGDLGIARTSDATSTVRLTETGTIVGTIDYLAPEQLDEHDVTTATDVYAVGLLLVECTTGEKPFGEGTLAERAARRLARSPEPPADIRPALRDAIVAAVHREPEERPQSGHELATRLAPAVEDEHEARGELAGLVARTLAAPLDQRRAASPRPASTPSGSVDVDTVAYTPTGVEVELADVLAARDDREEEQAPAGFRPDLQRLALEMGGLVLAILATVALSTAIIG